MTERLADIEARLRELEATALELEPDAKGRAHLRESVLRHGDRFLESLASARAFVVEEGSGEGLLDAPIRDEGRPIEELLDLFEREVERPGLNPASGGHLAYIPGGGLYPSALGDYLADVTNRYSGVFYVGYGAVRMENQLVRWMAEVVGYLETAHGDLTSGGSLANLAAIVAARDAMEIRAADVPRAAIYSTAQVHHCVGKAIRIAGLGEAPLREVPMDARYRMDAAALGEAIAADRAAGLRPFLIVASAGTTDTGAIDPLADVARVAKANDVWLHIDAAYGGFFALCDGIREKLAGLREADSIVLDPHKGLFLPYGSGAVLVRDGAALRRAHDFQAAYLQDAERANDEPSPARYSAELTRPFRGMRMWLPLQLFGVAPFRAALAEKHWLARYFHERVQAIPGMEVGPEPELSVAMYRYVPETGDADAFNERLVQAVQADGRVFLSSTRVDGRFYLRLAVLCFRTHRATVDLTLEVLREKIEELRNG